MSKMKAASSAQQVAKEDEWATASNNENQWLEFNLDASIH